ncbi:integrator complex subunit 7 [Microplitis demolitor]|uniref:integrator complex subunit 7 n=1 Tax=Microplitis demolitor TaxID=69319 RepID=UPI0004CDC463|nr:integrator complex subunit 7 [Microplitis demolitor]
MNAFNDTVAGEPEQDANSALIELDKGLRSKNTGERCEAIVRFPRLFEKYPFPILINSALLKLADVFRLGSNFLRVWVLRVCQQSEKHLDKILNVDEFVRRIYSVIHSNDPVARALTLRTLGSAAGIIPERQQVHHSIRKSLDSHDSVEVEAAIYAARMFAAQSKLFAVSMCSKISDMIRGQATPASMKLQLIPILQYMHHDTSTASMVNELCMELLASYPAVEFVRVTLSAMSTLASATLIDVPNQVALLLKYLRDDPRLSVKRHALRLLLDLAKRGAHLWPRGALDNLVDSTTRLPQDNNESTDLLLRTLDVIEVLSRNAVTCDGNKDENSPLSSMCIDACYSHDPLIAVKAVMILSRIACYCYEENLPVNNIQHTISCLESLIVLLATEDKYVHHLKMCLGATVKLCQAHFGHAPIFVDVIGSTLMNSSSDYCRNDKQSAVLCEALGAIGSLGNNVLLPLLPDILEKLKHMTDAHTKVMLCTLLFQIVAGGYEWNEECMKAILTATKTVDGWAKYRIARGAARYGHHGIASEIFKNLKETVASEQLHFWLSGLELLTSAESYLASGQGENHAENKARITEKLNGAISKYASACASLKAASTPLRSLQFACEYAKLRCEFLQALVQLVHSCRSLCTSPPPAIAMSIVVLTKDEFQRYGRVTYQLRKSAQDFRTCADNYYKLYQSAFDADQGSLNNIRALQEICLLMANSVDRVCSVYNSATTNQRTEPTEFMFGDSVEMRQLAKCCAEVQRLGPIWQVQEKEEAISHSRIESLISQVMLLAGGKIRLPMPRYFFQALQATVVKLSVSPQPRVLGEPVCVPQGSQLALKIEGVLRHGRRASLFRSVAAVCISISTSPPSKINADTRNGSTHESNGNELQQTVIPHRDFFACEFLLSLGSSSAGGLGNNNCAGNIPGSSSGSGSSSSSSGTQFQVTASASILDKDGNVWKCGPRSTLQVRVHEEPTKRKLP